jgi:hypothetical protein
MTPANYGFALRGELAAPKVDKPAVIGAKFLQTLDELSVIDPLLSGWQVYRNWNIDEDDEPRQLPLGVARKRIVEIIENGVARDDFGEPRPSDGYIASAAAGVRGPRQVTFTASTRLKDFTLEFGEWNIAQDLSIVTYPLFKAALLAISTIWNVRWAYAKAHRKGMVKVPFALAPGVPGFIIESAPPVPLDPTFPRSGYNVPWIVYLSPRHAADVKVAREILTEHTPNGGLLMSATTDRLDPTNPAHVRAARILAEMLIALREHSS